MLKREIHFVDFDGNPGVETHSFHLTKAELVEFETNNEGGFKQVLERIVETNDAAGVVAQLKRIVLMSYGVREGARFRKDEEAAKAFLDSPAYDALFIELISDPDKLVEFIQGVIPKDLLDQVLQMEEQAAATLPPPTAAV